MSSPNPSRGGVAMPQRFAQFGQYIVDLDRLRLSESQADEIASWLICEHCSEIVQDGTVTQLLPRILGICEGTVAEVIMREMIRQSDDPIRAYDSIYALLYAISTRMSAGHQRDQFSYALQIYCQSHAQSGTVAKPQPAQQLGQ